MEFWIGLLLFGGIMAVVLYRYWDRRQDEKWHAHVPNQLIVSFHDGVTPTQIAEIHKKAKCEMMENDPELGIYKIASKRKMRRILKHYQGLAETAFVEPNYLFQASAAPNDPYFSLYQYGPQRISAPAASSSLQSAIQYAWDRGAVIVAAAGNAGSSLPSYPANYPNVIAVGSTNEREEKSAFSNYGRWVDVAAPGENILSTYPGSYYAYLSGTSMAAPHVAGIAALLASQGKTNVQIQRAIKNTSDPIPGTGAYWLYGRVNAAKAVQAT